MEGPSGCCFALLRWLCDVVGVPSRSQCLTQVKPSSWPQLKPPAPSKLLNSPGRVLQGFLNKKALHKSPSHPNSYLSQVPAGSRSR